MCILLAQIVRCALSWRGFVNCVCCDLGIHLSLLEVTLPRPLFSLNFVVAGREDAWQLLPFGRGGGWPGSAGAEEVEVDCTL